MKGGKNESGIATDILLATTQVKMPIDGMMQSTKMSETSGQ